MSDHAEDDRPLRLVRPAEAPADDARDDEGREIAVREPAAVAEQEPIEGTVLPWRAPVRPQRIFAAWIINRDERMQAGRWLVVYVGHTSAFHVVRVPVYVTQAARWAPRGAVRAVRAWAAWAYDAEGRPLRTHAIQKGEIPGYMSLSRQRNDRVKLRLAVSGGVVAGGGVLYEGLSWDYSAQMHAVELHHEKDLDFIGHHLTIVAIAPWALLVLLVLVLGYVGRPIDKAFFAPAVLTGEVAPKLTPSQVIGALGSLGIEGINRALGKDGDGITFAFDIGRDGPGWRADVDLPLGVTAGMVIARRDRLASGLRRPLGCVWPEGDPAIHEGRLVLWCGDRDLSKTMVKWPLARGGQHDVFQRVPFGADPRGRPISVPLIGHNILLGSLPGNGKTASVRVLACGAALDPTCELWLHELKGTGDLDPLEIVAHRFVSGIDDDSIAYAAESLSLLRKEVMRRAEALKRLPRDLCPDKKVTREIANRRQLGLHPLTAVFDEVQNLFAHPEYGSQAGDDAVFIIKIGRALGVHLILATQRPDKDSLPTGVSGNVSIRFCMHVAGQTENDMVLGTSAYKNGIRATMFRPEIDAGIGYLKGATATPIVVRSAYLDQEATEKIAARARALREAAGTLTGHAAGEDTSPEPTVSLLADLAGVLRSGEDKAWCQTLVERLAELRPALYADWSPGQLTEALKPYGVATRDTWIDGKNRKGLTAKAVRDALSHTAREGR